MKKVLMLMIVLLPILAMSQGRIDPYRQLKIATDNTGAVVNGAYLMTDSQGKTRYVTVQRNCVGGNLTTLFRDVTTNSTVFSETITDGCGGSVAASVDWSDLTGIPADIADGDLSNYVKLNGAIDSRDSVGVAGKYFTFDDDGNVVFEEADVNFQVPNSHLKVESSDTVVSYMLLGDSKFNDRTRGAKQLRQKLYDKYGYAGQGYGPFGTQTPINTWYQNNGCDILNGGADLSLNGYGATLADVGDFYRVFPEGTEYNTSDEVDIYYLQSPTGGVIDVTYGGNTTQVNTSGVLSKQKVTLTATEGQNELRIDHVSGTSTIYEFNLKLTTAKTGVILHRVAHGGYRTTSFQSVLSNDWNDGILQDLSPDHLMIRLGANDWTGSEPLDNVRQAYTDIVDKIGFYNSQMGVSIVGVEDLENGKSNESRVAYENTQSYIANVNGWGFVPLSYIIPDWVVWDSLGYANDNIHSNELGGDIIGNYLFECATGKKMTYAYAGATSGYDSNTIPFANEQAVTETDINKLSYFSAMRHLGINNPNPQYNIDLPNIASTDFQLGAIKYTGASGLVFDNTSLEGDVLWNIDLGNDFVVNLVGSDAKFDIEGNVPIELGRSLSLGSEGGFVFDNTDAEGDVSFSIDTGNDYNINLSSSSSEFIINTQGSDNFIVDWNLASFEKTLLLNSVSTTSVNWGNGLLFKDSANNAVREADWTEVSQQILVDEIPNSNFYSNSRQLIKQSPNGTCYEIFVDNTGNLTTTAVTCP